MEQISRGTLLKFNNGSFWRVIMWQIPCCRLIQTETTKREIITMNTSEVLTRILDGDIVVAEDQQIRFVDDALINNPKELESVENKRHFIGEIRDLLGPSYVDLGRSETDVKYKEIFERHNMSRGLANRTVLRWLQSGMQDSSLFSKTYNGQKRKSVYTKKTGKPGHSLIFKEEDFKEAFEYGLSLLKKQRLMSITKAFNRVLVKFYLKKDSETEGSTLKDVTEQDIAGKDISVKCPELYVPESERPTIWQFRNYVKKNISAEEWSIIKTSNRDYRNNERLLLGAASFEVGLRPGFKLEVDELENDLQIVSEYDHQQNIGRAGIYVAIDVYSHRIVAFFVGLETNSNIGLNSLFLNLFENKNKLLKDYGITLNDDKVWSAGFIPNTIRTDNGSDFVSKQTQEICKRLGITIETVEPGMGSLKGNIEQSFRKFHNSNKSETENSGYMQKRYDSNHYREACLVLKDVFKLMVDFVAYNNSFYTEKRYLTPDMFKDGVTKTPISIWDYGVKHYGKPELVTPERYKICMFDLLVADEATISKSGILYKGLEYIPLDDSVLTEKMRLSKFYGNRNNSNGKKINSLPIRYDPRSVDALYYVQDNEIKMLVLKSKFKDLKEYTWQRYNDYRKHNAKLNHEGRESNEIVRAKSAATVATIVKTAEIEAPTYASKENLLEARKAEKYAANYANRISTRIEPDAPKIEQDEKVPRVYDGADYDLIEQILSDKE